MPNKILPALNADMWRVVPKIQMEFSQCPVEDGDIALEPTLRARSPERLRHALAALALHGQPFGFTREDAVVLRLLDGAKVRTERDRIVVEIVGAAFNQGLCGTLAARIEALLPPEESNG